MNMSRLGALLMLWLVAGSVQAHTAGTSFLALHAQRDASIHAAWDFDVRDLHQLLGLDRDADGVITWGEMQSRDADIRTLVLARTRLRDGDRDCSLVAQEPLALADHGEGPYARLGLTFSCPQGAGQLTLDPSGWFEFDPGHRALLEYEAADGSRTQAILSRDAAQWQVQESHASRLARFLAEGIRHLLTGYDHLAFLGVLLLALVRRSRGAVAVPLKVTLRRALGVITAFTIAHSLTLGLAATGLVRLPSQPVEVAIALSVLVAALLNLRQGAADHGWKLAFAFGLVHGLGFATALAELASGRIDLLALAAFNIGIEAAQIAIAAAAVPLMWWLFRSGRSERIGVPLASLCVAGLAAVWIGLRITA
ncbi:MAG TPA: HupE/UreJ family protein [Povalibacter sp.]|nr:HupE/UreJ family protein [Povalibacter sp.]